MIISPRRNYIFVHIPKTGGTSLALALEARAHKDDILIGDTPKALRRRQRLKGHQARGRLWKHSTLADIDGFIDREFVANAFCVTLVRNPWDRLVSLYHWLQFQEFQHPMVTRAQTVSFAEFLSAKETQAALRLHTPIQSMRDATGEERATLYIRLEHFERDAAPFWDHLGFALKLPHENRSDRDRDYRRYYDDALAALVADICTKEIDRFGYGFDPPSEE